MTFRDVMPLRQRPLFRIDANGLAFISPQFITEKGGIDLFWLLTNQTQGVQEERPWMDDFGAVFEGYVDLIFKELPASLLGGSYEASIKWRLDAKRSGEIDGLIHSDTTLFLIETKGSLLRQTVLSRGNERELQQELEKKFVVGPPGKPKGVTQLVRALELLARERRQGRRVRGVNLEDIDWIIPVLVVADRSLRFPPMARWFDSRFRSLLRRSWGRVGPLVLCSIEDLEGLEQQALEGQPAVAALKEYGRRFPKAQEPVAEVIVSRWPYSRLDRSIDQWIRELIDRRVLPP